MKIFITILLLVASGIPTFAQAAAPIPEFPAWIPPEARLKSWTVFAPKPIKGDNIFQGEAEKWLADAIVKLEGIDLDLINDKAVSDYVSQLGLNLVKYSTAPKKHFEFIVLNSRAENAFNIGAGRVYINLGLLQNAKTEDELASVIAHEIAHDTFGHAAKAVTRQMFWMTGKRKVKSAVEAEKALSDLLDAYEKHTFAAIGENLLGWSRVAELEADRAGFYNIFKAGYNPEAMKDVFRRFVAEKKEEAGESYKEEYFFTLLFGSHPPSSQRVTALKWESNWIKMPPKESSHKSAAFDAMKIRVKGL